MANHDKFLIDSISPEDVYTPICHSCKHWGGNFTCTAYQDGIPLGIITGALDHHQHLPGDHGIHWEAIEDDRKPKLALFDKDVTAEQIMETFGLGKKK